MDWELWWLSCIYFFTVSASSAVILLRAQRTTLCQYGLWLIQQLWKGMNASLTVQHSYFPLLSLSYCLLSIYYMLPPILSLCTVKIS